MKTSCTGETWINVFSQFYVLAHVCVFHLPVASLTPSHLILLVVRQTCRNLTFSILESLYDTF